MTLEYDNQVLSKLSPMLPLGLTTLRSYSYLKAFNDVFDVYVIEYFSEQNQEFIWEYFTLERLLVTYSLLQDEFDDMIMFCNLEVTTEFITYKSVDFYCCKAFIRFDGNGHTVRVIGRSICHRYLIEKISIDYFAPHHVSHIIVDLRTLSQMQTHNLGI